jgi:subtilase family serine protease
MKKQYSFVASILVFLVCSVPAQASSRISSFKAALPIHSYGLTSAAPKGYSPQDIKKAYSLPLWGGQGTIAIIAAYDDPGVENDLNIFSKQFGLALCTSSNGCFEKYSLDPNKKTNAGWGLEKALDAEWAHAIAPQAHILLVEAKSASGPDLIDAVDYARKRKDVVAVSMSWGGREFTGETELDPHFVSPTGASFFASSGDSGAGVSWPAVSQNVIGVGGTTLQFSSSTNRVLSEKAWSGSGGGISSFESQPLLQKNYDVLKSRGMRAVPDVSFDADPQTGFSVYHSNGTKKNWYVLGGTSAGAPQWAAIHSLGLSATMKNLYTDKSSTSSELFFRDIKTGSNGNCTYYCTARSHYDFITGLGSPLTYRF